MGEFYSFLGFFHIFIPPNCRKMTKDVSIDGEKYLNMASTNFLSFIGVKRIEDRAKQTIFKYGVGSCGPRGFYGTVDVHLDLEKELAK